MLDTQNSPPLYTPSPKTMRVGLISTYPPTRCGIGRFASSLVEAIDELDAALDLQVVRLMNDLGKGTPPPEVVMEIDPESPVAIRAASRHLNRLDLTIVQHEFGIYGADEGRSALDLVSAIETPKMVVLHTVLAEPNSNQRWIVESFAEEATIIVLCESAANLLQDRYSVPPDAIEIIRHGARWSPQTVNEEPRRQMITWGLLGPGKGLERSIRAVASLRDISPPVRYLIVGRTHPSVVARHGYEYRHFLQALVEELGVEDIVKFIDRYVSDDELFDLVSRSDLVVVPYDNHDQVSSGVITEAAGLGRPTVATRFPYSEEILGEGAGLVVDHDEESLAHAMRTLMEDPVAYARATRGARRLSLDFSWRKIASDYLRLFQARARDADDSDLLAARVPGQAIRTRVADGGGAHSAPLG
ncbi:MAG: glycosyltransferase [Actinomycetota bacterium]